MNFFPSHECRILKQKVLSDPILLKEFTEICESQPKIAFRMWKSRSDELANKPVVPEKPLVDIITNAIKFGIKINAYRGIEHHPVSSHKEKMVTPIREWW